jgi:predicted nucleic acid-binding protein
VVVYFFDPSALVKQYMDEPGSEWARHVLSQLPPMAIAEITIVEAAAALARRWRMGEITAEEYRFAKHVFLEETRWARVVSARRSAVEWATDLIDRHPLRAYDALQVATALELNRALEAEGFSLTFVSADDRLCAAAEHEGLTTVNPNPLP